MRSIFSISAPGEIVRLGLIGDPVAHSLSPTIFDLLFEGLGLGRLSPYRAWRVSGDGLGTCLNDVRQSAMLGLNVTIPYKERVIPWLDDLDPAASLLGAVNVIGKAADRLKGYNTDWIGFLRSLQVRNIAIAGREAVVLGAGGAAKAVVYALILEGIAQVTVYNRSASRAETLTREMRQKTGFSQLYALRPRNGANALVEALQSASLLINATSVGMYPQVNDSPLADPRALHAGLLVYDLIYNPLQTRLMRQAETCGAQTINGLDMLIYQALESLKIWLGTLNEPWMREAEARVPSLRECLIRQLQSSERGA